MKLRYYTLTPKKIIRVFYNNKNKQRNIVKTSILYYSKVTLCGLDCFVCDRRPIVIENLYHSI